MNRKTPKVDDLDAALAAALVKQADAAQATLERKADVTAGKAALQIVREKADTFARQSLAPGEKLDPAERRRHATVIAVGEHELAIEQRALDEAIAAEAVAGVEVGKARLLVTERDARALRRPEGETLIALADATAAYVQAVEAARGAHLTRLEADGEAEALRAELQGREPSRAYRHDDAGELRRFLAGLPMAFVMTLHIEWPVADVDLRKMGADYIARAAA